MIKSELQFVLDNFYVFDELNDGDLIIEEESSYKYRVIVNGDKVANVIPYNDCASEERSKEIKKEIEEIN